MSPRRLLGDSTDEDELPDDGLQHPKPLEWMALRIGVSFEQLVAEGLPLLPTDPLEARPPFSEMEISNHLTAGREHLHLSGEMRRLNRLHLDARQWGDAQLLARISEQAARLLLRAPELQVLWNEPG